MGIRMTGSRIHKRITGTGTRIHQSYTWKMLMTIMDTGMSIAMATLRTFILPTLSIALKFALENTITGMNTRKTTHTVIYLALTTPHQLFHRMVTDTIMTIVIYMYHR